MAGTESPKAKAPFSWQDFLSKASIAIIGAAAGFLGSYVLQIITKETKTIMVSTSWSDNLAALPTTDENNLEVFLTLPHNRKQSIKSLFKYEATVRNTSELGIHVFKILVSLPKDTAVVTTQPYISSNSPQLIDVIDIASVDSTTTKQEYEVSLLNPGQSLTLSYYIYAAEALAPPSMAVLVQKKDWIQTVVPPVPRLTADRPDPFPYIMVAFVIGFLIHPLISLILWIVRAVRRSF